MDFNEIILNEYYSIKAAKEKGRNFDTLEQFHQTLYDDYAKSIEELLNKHKSKQYLSIDELSDLAHMYIFLYRKGFMNPQTRERIISVDDAAFLRKLLIDRGLVVER